MGARRPRPIVLDTGAFTAFEKNDRKLRTLIELALAHGVTLMRPAGSSPTRSWPCHALASARRLEG